MRERLIGAVVLVVIAVIVIPWLVSRAHHPEDVVTHRPWPASASTPPKPYILPLQAKRSVAPGQTADGSEAVANAHGQSATAQSLTPPVTHAATGVAQAAAPNPSGRQTATTGSSPVKKSAVKGTAKIHGWSIQAASFSDVKSARELAGKLEQAGFKVALVPNTVKGTRYYQVRVGPYDSEKLARDAAPGVARISNTKVLVRAPGSDNG